MPPGKSRYLNYTMDSQIVCLLQGKLSKQMRVVQNRTQNIFSTWFDFSVVYKLDAFNTCARSRRGLVTDIQTARAVWGHLSNIIYEERRVIFDLNDIGK